MTRRSSNLKLLGEHYIIGNFLEAPVVTEPQMLQGFLLKMKEETKVCSFAEWLSSLRRGQDPLS